MKFRLALLILCSVALVAALAPTTASAEAKYQYEVFVYDAAVSSSTVYVNRLDKTQDGTIRVRRGVNHVFHSSFGAGNPSVGFGVPPLLPGDVVQVFHPASVEPPVVPPTEEFEIPAVTNSPAAGTAVVSGSAPDGTNLRVRLDDRCFEPSDSIGTTHGPGTYSGTFPTALRPGDLVTVTDYQADGDAVSFQKRVAGETPCFDVEADDTFYNAYDELPYEIEADYLFDDSIPTVKLVLRRGGAVVAETEEDQISLTRAQKPLPGDVVELYRPKTAPAPTSTFTVPQVSGVVDIGNNRVAVTAPAASSLNAYACSAYDCAKSSDRTLLDFAGGRALFDFTVPIGEDRAMDIQAGDWVRLRWESRAQFGRYYTSAVPGDLTAPVVSFKLASKLKASKLKKLSVKLKSSEPGAAAAALTTTVKGKKGKKKIVTLAKGARGVPAGSATLKLKLTKAGKKLVKQLARTKKREKSIAVNLTATVTDAAGNAASFARKSKLADR